MEQTDVTDQLGSETAVSKDVEAAYGGYLKVFQDCLRAAGLPDDAAETVETQGHKLGLEIVSKEPRRVFLAEEVLPDSLQGLPQAAYGFPVAITKIVLGRRDVAIQCAPQHLTETPAGRGMSSAATLGDAIYPGRSTEYPNQIFANEIRFSLEGGVMFLGTFSISSSQKGYMNNEDATWTPKPLSPRQIIDFGRLVRYGEYLNNAQTRIVVDRTEPLPSLDTAISGFTALRK